jgi:hypothetical protein
VTVVPPLKLGQIEDLYLQTDWNAYQLLPMTVIGEQLNPMSTSRPVRSRPRGAATIPAALLEEDCTLEQH